MPKKTPGAHSLAELIKARVALMLQTCAEGVLHQKSLSKSWVTNLFCFGIVGIFHHHHPKLLEFTKNSDLQNWMGCFTPRPCWSPDSRSDNLQVEPLKMRRTHGPTEGESILLMDKILRWLQYPIIYKVLTVPGAGFLPSTVSNLAKAGKAIDSKVPDGISYFPGHYIIWQDIQQVWLPPLSIQKDHTPFWSAHGK